MQPQKYLTVFNLGIQNTFVYRWNYLLRAIFGVIPLAGTIFLWRAIFRESGGGMRGYDYGSMIYYYLLTILVSNLVTQPRTNGKLPPTFARVRSIPS
jgi:ABC-2 type transport system permease protein